MIIFYPPGNDHGSRLVRTARLVVPKESTVVFHDLEAIRNRITAPNRRDIVLLFLAGSPGQLQELARFGALLADLKKIIVLPDGSRSTMKEACRLYPSFMTEVSHEFRDIQDVLMRLKERYPEL